MRFGFNFGMLAGSQALAAILYQTSLGDFVYSTLAESNKKDFNYITNTDMSTADWVARGFTKNSHAELDPLGGFTATKITENNTDANPAFYYNPDITDGSLRELEVWIKADRNESIALSVQGDIQDTNINVTTEWEKFTVSSTINGATGSHIGGFFTMTQGSGLVLYVWSPSVKDVIALAGTIVLDNQGSLGSTSDGLLYSSRFIELGATNDVDIPIHHTLGADRDDKTWNAIVPSNTDGTTHNVVWNFVDGTTNTDPSRIVNSIFDGTETLVTFTISSVVSGSIDVRTGDNGNPFGLIGLNTVGTYSFETNWSSHTDIWFKATNDENTDVTITNVSVKQIINPNSYLTYYDFTDGLVTLGNSVDGGSSDNLELIGSITNSVPTNTTVTEVNGVTNIELLLNTGTDTDYYSCTTEIGKTYDGSINILQKASQSHQVWVGTTRNNASYYNSGVLASNGIVSFSFVATSTIAYIGMYLDGNIGEIVKVSDATTKEILPISTKYTLNTKTVNNFLTHTTPWSASDWTKINNNPNLIGKLALETTGATKTISELDMVMDRSGEKVLDNSFNSSANWTLKGNTSIVNGQLIIDTTVDSDYYQNAIQYIGIESGKTYYYEIDIASTTDELWLIMDTNSANWVSFNTAGVHTGIITVTTAQSLYLEDRHSTDGVHIINSISVKEVVQDSYYMCSEKSGAYLVDSRVAYGTDLRTDWLTHSYTTALVTLSTAGGTLEITATADTSGDYQIYDSAGNELVTTVGKIYAISGTLVSNNFVTYTATGLSVYDLDNAIENLSPIDAQYGAVGETVTYLFKATGTTSRIYPIKVRQASGHTIGTTASVKDISVREATAKEIANYAETIRTNADLQQKGIQTTAFVTDGAGVPQSYSSKFLQFNGDSRYVDTGWSPAVDDVYTIEYVMEIDISTEQNSGNLSTRFRQFITSGATIFYSKDYYVNYGNLTDATIYHLIAIHNADGTITGYVNGVNKTSTLFATTFNSANFLLGKCATQSVHKAPIGLFKVHKNKAMTATEAAAAYAKAKEIYPTLP